jgi:predicted glutamine amidotransferase
MCRIIYALNQPYLKSKIKHFFMQTTNHPAALDGYGLAALNPATRKWRIYKSHRTPDKDPKSTEVADVFAEYPLVIGHLRNANLGNAPNAKQDNTHPFYYRNHVFVHNGRIEDAHLPVARKWFQANTYPEYWSNMRGDTDSECLFYLLLSTIKRREWIYKDIDMLENRGCKSPSKFQELRDAVQECFQLLHAKFHMYLANFVYADKEYSIVGRLMKNATAKDNKNNALYFSGKGDRILFVTDPLTTASEFVDWGKIYVIHNATGKYESYLLNIV